MRETLLYVNVECSSQVKSVGKPITLSQDMLPARHQVTEEGLTVLNIEKIKVKGTVMLGVVYNTDTEGNVFNL